MNNRTLFFHVWLLAILLLPLSMTAQTLVVVTSTDGNETTYEVQETGKLFFSESDLMIEENDGNVVSVALSGIRKINFESTVNIVENSVSERLLVFPNPATQSIRIANTETSNFDVVIYSMQGTVVLKGRYTNDDSIDISSLPTGLYLIRIDEKVVKFCKL